MSTHESNHTVFIPSLNPVRSVLPGDILVDTAGAKFMVILNEFGHYCLLDYRFQVIMSGMPGFVANLVRKNYENLGTLEI
jgi:hypothetical protein